MTATHAPSTGPDEVGHTHADVAGGWLRASVFGAMDGLVTNISLVAGVGAAGASARVVILTGFAGLVAGAFSMALGEYTSVRTQNEQVDREWAVEKREIRQNPDAEQRELSEMFMAMGMRRQTALAAAREVHGDVDQAAVLHISQELGLDPTEQPSPWVAGTSSFVTFSIGAIVPLIPYVLGYSSLVAGLAVGALGLLIAGALASVFTVQPWWRNALRQLCFGAIAVTATYLVGTLIGTGAGST
jgi:VIT1/CCC1 family predicted Fe2+/Mn2+ transporter